jgi:maltose-binding protein MalE
MSRFKSINFLMGIVMVLAFSLGTMATASAHTQKLAFKGQHLVVWDYFTPFSGHTAERTATIKVIAAWEKATGGKATEAGQPAAGGNAAFLADPKKGPDIIGGPDDQAGAWAGTHLLSPVHMKASLYTPAAVSACRLNGKTWCYPWALDDVMLYYNKAFISAKQIAALKTWTQLAAWAKAFHKTHPTVWGFGDQISETYKANTFLTAYGGGDIYHSSKGYNGKKVIVGSAATAKGLNAFKSFFNTADGSAGVKNYLTDGSYDADLTHGTAAIVLTGPWDDENYKAGHINYGVAPLPGFKEGGKIVHGKSFTGVQVWAVNKYSRHNAAAQSLARYLSTHEEIPLYHASGRIPATRAALKKVSSVPELKAYSKQFLHSEPLPNVPQMSYVWNCTADAIELTFEGHGSASSNLKRAQANIKHYIKAGAGSCAAPS